MASDAQLGLNFAEARGPSRDGGDLDAAAPGRIRRQAAELLYTGRLIDGAEAHRIGLANRVLPAGEVLGGRAGDRPGDGRNAPIAVRAIKRACGEARAASLEDQLQFEASEQARTFETPDAREGIAAIRERRPPRFAGR